MFGMEVSWDNRHLPYTLVAIANKVTPQLTPYHILIEFTFSNKAKSFLANVNSIQVNKQDLLRLHTGCHGDFIAVATK